MALEIKSIASLVGTAISYAYAVKAGPWVFLTGHEAFDWRTGTIDASVRPGWVSGLRHPPPEPPRGGLRAAADDGRAARVRD